MITASSCRFASGVTALCLLTACTIGGSDGGSSGPSFDALASQGLQLADKIAAAETTPVENMPTSGSATYAGVAGFSQGYAPETLEDLEILAQIQLEADFSSGSIGGSMSNFSTAHHPINGTISIDNGQITDNHMTADLSGTLSGEGETVEITGTMGGTFEGENAEYIAGGMDAEGDFGDGHLEYFYGLFGVEAQ